MPLRRPTWRLPRAVGAAPLSAAVTGLAGAGSALAAAASAAAARADLVVEVTANPAEVNPAGGDVQVAVMVRNVGYGLAEDVAVKVRPPAGTTLAPPPNPGSPRWRQRRPRPPRAGSATTAGGDAPTGRWPAAAKPRSSPYVCGFRAEASVTSRP